MHADELVGPLGGRGDGRDGDGGGIGGQNGLGLADLIQLGEDGLLDVQVLDGGLYHQIGIRSQVQVGGKSDLAGNGGLAGLVQLALGHLLVQALVQTGLTGLDDLIADVAHHDVKPLFGKNLSNVQTHAAADDNNLFHDM